MTISMALGWVLAYYWQRNRTLLRPVNFEANARWTERDQQAWKLVEARAAAGKDLEADKLSDPKYYVTIAQEMGLELATFYHPKGERPGGQSDRAGDAGRRRTGVARPGADGGQVSAGRPPAHHQRLETRP